MRVQKLWAIIRNAADVEVHSIQKDRALTDSLLELTSIADEACRGVGIPGATADTPLDLFDQLANLALMDRGTLCMNVDPSRVRVLPKLHSPKFGMTLRSLTHHVCLVASSEVEPRWFYMPGGPEEHAGLNLLLVPWPKRVVPDQFAPAHGRLENMGDDFGFFTFSPRRDGSATVNRVVEIYEAARSMVGHVHGVVFPELALTELQRKRLRQKIAVERNSFLVAGIAAAPDEHGVGANYVTVEFPTAAGVVTIGPQHKHHRWQLESNQILQYGLGTHLSHKKCWWENIKLKAREINFLAVNPWLTIATLICEDLARQDPVADLLRAVGPNLVLTLLMDGPQLKARWSARYATVLADDPGCSVLTLTSLGMASMCRPFGTTTPLRNIALWKDAKTGGPHEIVLPDKSDGVILTLSAEFSEEWSADGRSDGGGTGYPTLTGIHPVYVDAS
jgi:hypothetical protein